MCAVMSSERLIALIPTGRANCGTIAHMTDHALPARRRVVTQRDVAEAAGVDRATVSRALDPAKRPLISPETVERVLRTAERMGYRANLLARGLRTARSGVIGLEIPMNIHDATSLFDKPLSVFVTSVEERLSQLGLTLLVTFANSDATDTTSDRITRNGMIDGLIKLYAAGNPKPCETTQVPGVSVGLDPELPYDLVINEAHGVEIAVEHMHRLGHRRIGFVCEPPSQPRGDRHLRAYRSAMRRLGIAQDPQDEAVAYYHERHPASAPKAVETILSQPRRPTAIVFTDDKAAMGGYGVLRSQRLQVPRDMSVVGWRDNDAGLFLVPPLTTIALPMRAAAFSATELLLTRIAHGVEAMPVKRVFDPYLVQRASAATPEESEAE